MCSDCSFQSATVRVDDPGADDPEVQAQAAGSAVTLRKPVKARSKVRAVCFI